MPLMAASVSTLVVSWKDDAEMNDSVESDAFVMPRSSGSATAGLAAALDDPLVLALEDVLLDLLVDQEVGVAHVLDAHAAEHLANDDLDVLVVDGDALQAVDLLDFVHEVRRELLLALHAQDVVRVRRTVHAAARPRGRGRPAAPGCACPSGSGTRAPDRSARAVVAERRDDDLALALGVLAEGNLAVDLGDDGVVLRLAGLEELGDARQTAGDVLRLRGLARDLGDDFAGFDDVAVLRRRCSRRPGGGSARRASRVRELERLARLRVA